MIRSKRIFIFILAIIGLISTSTQGQTTSKNGGLLFEVSGNGLEKPSYLHGTFHLLCKDELKLSSTLRESMEATEKLAFEIDMDDPQLMQKMQGGMMLTNGKTLQNYVTEEEYTALESHFQQNLKMNLAQMKTVKPFFLMSMMYPSLLNCKPVSYEAQLVQFNKDAGKEVVGLETVARQLEAINAIPLEDAADQLVKAVNDQEDMQKDFDRMKEAYLSGDLAALNDIIEEANAEMEGFNEVFLKSRNEEWVPVIEKMMQEQPTFIAVGAGHLSGEYGVIALLREQGYKVRPVNE